MTWRGCALIAVMLLAASGANNPVNAAPVDDFIRAEMQKQRIPGLSIAVVKDRRIVKLAGYGVANLETGTPAAPDTVYKIASLSKPFIASAVLLLAQQNRLRLDDPINPYLEGAPESWNGITIRQLLSHTSGLARDPADYHPYQEQKPMAVIASAYALPLSSAPGARFLYSNIGYYILAQIIEKAAAQPWEGFVADRLFKPAGLQATRPLTSAIVPGRASGYDMRDGERVNAENWVAARPSAAFLSSARDLARWDIFLDTHSPLSADSLAQMRTPPKLADGRTSEYGLGWYVETYLGHARIHHDGQYPGFRSTWERFPDDGLTVIILTNAGRPSVDAMALKVAGYYLPALAAPSFAGKAEPAGVSADSGAPATISFRLRADKAAPRTVLEMEIWDSDNKPVNKQTRSAQDFAAGETRDYDFTWTPAKPGRYWINLGLYGPKFTPNYFWGEHMGAITVK